MNAELVALASAIESANASLPPFVFKLLQAAPDSFDDERAGKIACTVREWRERGQPLDFAIIAEHHLPLLNFITAELSSSMLPMDAAEFHAEKAWQAFQVRRANSVFAEAQQSLAAAPQRAASIIAAARNALDAVASESSSGLPELIDACSFMAEPIKSPAELIEGILHKGSKLAFGGSSKSFKTWSLLDVAISVASGNEWLGFKTAQGKVLFVNFEIQPHPWQRRIAAVARAKGVELKPGQICLWNLRGHAADFRELVPRIVERCRTENFALIVLDPIYKLYGNTDENSAGNVALLLNSLETLATTTGAAIAFGAHFAKGNAAGKEAIDRISGSGVFARDPDSLLIFTKHEAHAAFTVETILRNFAPVEPFAVRWQFPLMQTADDLDPDRLKQPAGRKKKYDARNFLAVILDTSQENPISVASWAKAAKAPRNTLSDYLTEMRDKLWIKTTGDGNNARQYITNEGKAFYNGTLPVEN